MRLLTLFFALLFALPAFASDYARERKWADEVLPAVLTGDPVWLEQSGGHRFLTLYTEASKAKAGVIVVHGMGVHPDWGLISPLRQRLPDAGYATLSVQMPVLKADATGEDYPPTFDEAAERIAIAVAFMRAKGYGKIALVSHSMGSRMVARYLERQPNSGMAAWVAIGYPAQMDYNMLKFPVMDLYGENDLPQVLQAAKARAKGSSSNTNWIQVAAPRADHFFENREDELVGLVKGFLDKML
jgi:pimeloyl-ACP methyl ester carboxylesterase